MVARYISKPDAEMTGDKTVCFVVHSQKIDGSQL